MAHTATLHVKIEPRTARSLKHLARRRGRTVGELVRQAISVCYQPEMDGLSAPQRQAVEAYRGRYISVGKLAETLGCTVLDARRWLIERSVPQSTAFDANDATHA
ncbi:MAG: ribbon-helix-helix domain-containing protein [Verrucomicrobia bacterium]|nr:ribbon-helix-helix domain-containing protein [Verrucomicrobiota bacterium]